MKTYNIGNYSGTAIDLVRNLHKGSRAQALDDQTWMVETAQRITLQNGTLVRHDTAEHFIDDLMAADLLDAMVTN